MRILGIDVGTTSIKAVELDSAFGRYEVHEYHEQKLSPGSDPTQAITQMIQALPRKPDKIAVAMPTGEVTFRNLKLPTRDKKAIQAGVRFELDDELPFAIEQAVYDYSVLSQTKNLTEVHVAATLETHISTRIKFWHAAGVDPDNLTTEAWALRTILNRVVDPTEREMPILLAQIGHERTVFYVHWKGMPVLAREISWGGKDLTTAICQKYHIPMDQAEQAKLEHGFVIPEAQKEDATPEQIEFSDTLLQPLQNLIWEIRQVALTCKKFTHENVHAVYLSGGTSLLPGLGRVIEENLKIPCRHFQALSSIASSGITYSEQTDATFALASALSLCMVGSDRATGINLRKGLFSKRARGREFNMANLKRPLLGASIVTACLFASLFVQATIYKTRLQDADAQLEKSVRAFFGQLSGSAARNYLASPSTLRTAINKELGKQRDLSKLLGPNTRSPMEFLREISSSIPRDVVVDMTQFQVGAAPTGPDDSIASLTFLVSNPQTADRLNSLLSSRFAGIQQSKPEQVPAPDGSGQRWKVTFSGKLTEEAYGK